jgi:hypothetical protein
VRIQDDHAAVFDAWRWKRGRSETKLASPRVVVGATTERPVKATVFHADWQVVNAGVSLAHEATIIELPVLVAEGSEPIAAIVMPLISKPDGNPVAGECSQLLD